MSGSFTLTVRARSGAVSDERQALSFGQFCARARALSAYLKGLGVQPGDRVAIMTPNSIDYLALLHATAVGGFSLVPVNTRYGAAELRYLLDDAQPTVCIVDPAYRPLREQIESEGGLNSAVQWLEHLPESLPDHRADDRRCRTTDGPSTTVPPAPGGSGRGLCLAESRRGRGRSAGTRRRWR